MHVNLSRTLKALVGLLVLSFAASAQTTSIAGEVKGEDGQPLKDAWIKIDRKDIKGAYKVKTNKKGEYFHAGLPIGTYDITLEVDGKVRDKVQNVRTTMGDPKPVNFSLEGQKKQQESIAAAAASGTLTKEQARDMSPEQKAALEKAMKDRQQAMSKNKELNDAFNAGMEALKAQQYDTAITTFTKASEMDPKQHVIWANLAESLMGAAKTKTGDEQKALDNCNKALVIFQALHDNSMLEIVGIRIEELSQEVKKKR